VLKSPSPRLCVNPRWINAVQERGGIIKQSM
jgi:hypothetical protein